MNSLPARPRLWRALPLAVSFLIGFCGVLPAQDSDAGAPADLKGFVYLEPLEIRKEFLVRLGGVETDAALPDLLDADAQAEVLERLGSKFSEVFHVRVEGANLEFELEQLRFVRLDPKLGPVPDGRPQIESQGAMVAGTFAAQHQGFPSAIEVEWSLFSASQPTVEIVVEATAKPDLKGPSFEESLSFSAGAEVARCELPDINIPFGLLEVELTPPVTSSWPWILAAGFLALGGAIGVFGVTRCAKERGTVLLGAGLSIAFAAGIVYQTKQNSQAGLPDAAQTNALVETLLKNVYHAFSLKQESDIYDALAVSVDGDLLDELYVEIRQGLERGTDAPRVKVLEVAMIDCATRPSPGGQGIHADVSWASRGTVSHWGHSHQRHNSYQASLVIEPIEQQWKITEIEVESVTKA